MSSVNYLGIVRDICETFPEVEELRWRSISIDPFIITDLGTAPSNAYLPLTVQQVAFIHWRVKRWEVSYEIGSQSLTKTFTSNDGEDKVISVFNFSYPAKSVSYIGASPSTGIDLVDEKELVCIPFAGLIQTGSTPSPSVNINSTEMVSFEGGYFDGEEFEVNYSRSFTLPMPSITLSTIAYEEGGIEFDVGKIGNTYYWPYGVELNLEITNAGSDGVLFAEEIDGSLPPIRGRLTTVKSSGDQFPTSPYKVKIQVSTSESDVIELDLYDATQPSPETRFNVDGFNGITIKPKEYRTFDPNDGLGPIYDSTTGEQLRPFPLISA